MKSELNIIRQERENLEHEEQTAEHKSEYELNPEQVRAKSLL